MMNYLSSNIHLCYFTHIFPLNISKLSTNIYIETKLILSSIANPKLATKINGNILNLRHRAWVKRKYFIVTKHPPLYVY